MSILHISARRWFNRTQGNTYHSVTVYRDGVQVARVPYAYGYGSQYEETACDALEAAGIVPKRDRQSMAGLHYLRDVCKLTVSVECTDVQRKRDL